MVRVSLVFLAVVGACAPAASRAPAPVPADVPVERAWPLTRAERSGFLETSSYGDVLAFIEALPSGGALRQVFFGRTVEGRLLPLVLAGAAGPTASEARSDGRTRVLVMANIHAGEVEGKEVVQMLLREIAQARHHAWTDSLVLLFVPIYNADGNERVSTDNRSEQHGPFAGVGTRENAQGLDLNRDHTKLDSPEARALVELLDAYDPHVVVDLHTTNGTRHAYHLTYATTLHPATDGAIPAMLRERWLPDVTRAMRDDGWLAWYYGNLPIREWGMTGERGWYTFDYRPRFNTHYAGLRNRFGILSEAYSYASFEDRIGATHSFVTRVLDWAAAHATEIRSVTSAADSADLRGRRLPLRARIASSGDTIILIGAAEERINPVSGLPYLARVDSVSPERMPHYDRFEPIEWEVVPDRYVIPSGLTSVIELLRAHGVVVAAQLPRPDSATGLVRSEDHGMEYFRIDSVRVAERPFQGHREREVFGEWCPSVNGYAPGDVVVRMEQPLARLVFQLLEPRSPDGIADWGVLADAELRDERSRYPIRRVLARPLPESQRGCR